MAHEEEKVSRRTILVVEDDAGLNRLIRKTLEKAGFVTESAATGAEALRIAGDRDELIVLLDYLLPDMTGMEMVDAWVAADRRFSFVVMTGHGDEKIAVEMMKRGAREYITKSANMIEVLPQVMENICLELDREKKLQAAEEELKKYREHLEELVGARTREMEESNAQLHTEITERKRTEEALRNSERLYRAIGETIDYGVWVCDPEGRNTYASESFLKLVGLTQEQCSNFGWGDVLHPDDIERTIGAWKECVRTGGTWDIEHRFRGVDGQWHSVLARGVPIRNERGTITCWAGINLDISRLKQMEGDLRKAKDELELRVQERTGQLQAANAELTRSNADLQQFAYVSSHDLQEPLRMVVNFMQLLEKGYKDKLDGTAVKYIDYAVEGAMRMQTLIMDLLRYSRVNTRGQALSPTDSGKVLGAVLKNLHLVIEETGAKIIHSDLPAVMADETQLMQVFQNLIENALKFRREGQPPEIRIWSERKEKDWLFCVQDNGIGIAPEFSERIFIIFQRLHTRRHYAGNGIGLSIIKRIVERHGGRVWVDSRPGEGSAFYFTIPIDGVDNHA